MNNKRLLIYTLLFLSGIHRGFGQSLPAGSRLIRMKSSHTSFPDTARSRGHIYDSVMYEAGTHYRDSSILLLIPPGFSASKKTDLVFWFHGWRNNIDTALVYYHLADQFLASSKNAILVLAETARNAPDSYGGKLEQPDMFKFLVADILSELKKQKIIPKDAEPGHIVLAGHSGAFRVIARILKEGGMKIGEVDLFDALYGETEIFDHWVKLDTANRFINWYTNEGGGTDQVSLELMKQFKTEYLPFLLIEEASLEKSLFRTNRILFLHSNRAHNDIIFNPDNFRLLLESSPFLKSVKP